jgi:hypothetical protein
MAVFRHTGGRWMFDENADHSQLLADSAADLLAILATCMRDDHTNQSPP